jgi:hypothetical protein
MDGQQCWNTVRRALPTYTVPDSGSFEARTRDSLPLNRLLGQVERHEPPLPGGYLLDLAGVRSADLCAEAVG